MVAVGKRGREKKELLIEDGLTDLADSHSVINGVN